MRKLLTILFVTLFTVNTAAVADDNHQGEISKHALFLADKLAHELEFGKQQFADAYEINYDFLTAVYPLMDKLLSGDEATIRWYYNLLATRNSDLRWIMDVDAFTKFLDIDYLYFPVYAKDGKIQFRVYEHYSDNGKYYNKIPRALRKYKGEHAQTKPGSSYYRGRYRFIFYGAQRTPRAERLYIQNHINDFGK